MLGSLQAGAAGSQEVAVGTDHLRTLETGGESKKSQAVPLPIASLSSQHNFRTLCLSIN